MIASMSMYRLMSVSLLGLLLLSVVFAGLGLIGYDPMGILATAAIATVATALSTLMVASVFRQVVHLESSLITGLLIAFILPPTLQTLDLLAAALAGALAGASKYLLVVHGRHFLNPAALGTSAVVLMGLGASFWWIANPPMTPAIVLAGALIAWRSGLGSIALVGLGVGASALLARLVLGGEPVWSSLYLVATSYPLVFLGLFMLTEPLTMASRQRARILVAALVGLGVALPFSVDVGSITIYSSPELALLAGNVVALLASLGTRSPRSASLTLTDSEKRGDYGAVFTFALERPLRFRAGQWVEIHYPHQGGDQRGSRRVFSVVSAPHEAASASPTLRIATRLSTPGSSFKYALSGAPAGSTARISQVGGNFLLPRDTTTPLLLIAGGVGITPFLSHLAEDTHRGVARDTVVIDVRSNPDWHWDDAVLTGSGARHIITSRDELSAALDGVDDLTKRWCAVSGSPAFVRDTVRALKRRGVRKIKTDAFVGY